MTSSKETELRAPNKILQDRKGDCESGMRQMALECSVTIRYNQNAAHDANIRKFAMICKRIGGTTLLEKFAMVCKTKKKRWNQPAWRCGVESFESYDSIQ